jgi:polyferredoxin
VLPDRNPLFVTLSDGSIRNGYTLKILNMEPEPRTFAVMLEGLPGASLWLAGAGPDEVGLLEVEVEPDRLREIKVFVSQPPEATLPGTTEFAFSVHEIGGGETASEATDFHGPES